MNGFNKTLLSAMLMLCFISASSSQEGKNDVRGQLLYDTYCTVCHSTEIHWREMKVVSDWSGLVVQVRRWNYILDVSHYLNSTYYGYIKTAQDKSLNRSPLEK